jgi:hypothetical protein
MRCKKGYRKQGKKCVKTRARATFPVGSLEYRRIDIRTLKGLRLAERLHNKAQFNNNPRDWKLDDSLTGFDTVTFTRPRAYDWKASEREQNRMLREYNTGRKSRR